LDYFPLSVDYVERLYAGGKIKGSRWVKREGRPSDEAILAGRVIDRSIRPLFPKAFKNEVQIIVTVLSVDGENEPDILALNAVSAALQFPESHGRDRLPELELATLRKTEKTENLFQIQPVPSGSFRIRYRCFPI